MIYVITMIDNLNCNRTSTVGFFTNYEEAEDSVINNYMDINDGGLYNYAAIECMREGVYEIGYPTVFFKYNRDKDEYVEIEEPEDFRHTCMFYS